MAGNRKGRSSMAEQIKLINEYCQTGITDVDGSLENDITVSKFYNLCNRCRKATTDQSSVVNYGHLKGLRPKWGVVFIEIVPTHISEQYTVLQLQESYLDNLNTIEIAIKDISLRISNDVYPVLLTRIFRLFQKFSY